MDRELQIHRDSKDELNGNLKKLQAKFDTELSAKNQAREQED